MKKLSFITKHNISLPLLLITVASVAVLAGIVLNFIAFQQGFMHRNNSAFLSADEQNSPGLQSALSLQEAFRNVAHSITPAVVNISTEHKVYQQNPFYDFYSHFFEDVPQYREYTEQSLGSGVIINKDGHLLSNLHVVRNATKIQITLYNNKKYDAQVIGVDEKTDLALLKIITEKKESFPFAKLGNSDFVGVGDWAIAIGNPFGLNASFTVGVISATHRRDVGLAQYENYFQTDASINPGNSGGPLVNIKGEVIGINTAIASPTGANVGIGFAIPINMAKQILPELSTKGSVTRGYLGIIIQPVDDTIAAVLNIKAGEGLFIREVTEDSPAKKAGLEAGDVIINVDNENISTVSQLQQKIAAYKPNTRVKMIILHDGKKKTIKVTIGKMPTEENIIAQNTDETIKPWNGITVQSVSRSLQQEYKLDASDMHKVIVIAIDPKSSAKRSDIQRGDIILGVLVHQKKIQINSLNDWKTFINKYTSGTSILLSIKRGHKLMYIPISDK